MENVCKNYSLSDFQFHDFSSLFHQRALFNCDSTFYIYGSFIINCVDSGVVELLLEGISHNFLTSTKSYLPTGIIIPVPNPNLFPFVITDTKKHLLTLLSHLESCISSKFSKIKGENGWLEVRQKSREMFLSVRMSTWILRIIYFPPFSSKVHYLPQIWKLSRSQGT